MEQVQWKVEGMDCNTCAINIHKYLEKQGLKNVKVNYATGDVLFETIGSLPEEKITKGISDLGYTVVNKGGEAQAHGHDHGSKSAIPFLTTHLQRFWVCFPFTAVLMLHMIPGVHIHWLMNHWVQLALTIPVYLVGMSFLERVPGRVSATACPI